MDVPEAEAEDSESGPFSAANSIAMRIGIFTVKKVHQLAAFN